MQREPALANSATVIKGLNGRSLPLDVGQTDDIPVHLRRLVALRDQTCQFPGGYFL
jgi:hypothetical protein